MPIRIVRRGQMVNPHYSEENQCTKMISETDTLYAERVSKLIDEENWHIVQVLEENEPGYTVEPVFILKQTIKPEVTAAKVVDLAEVEGLVKEGWVVEALYAKTATLKKLSDPKEQDYVEAAKKTAEIANETLKECPK